jgi:hypothetical protein
VRSDGVRLAAAQVVALLLVVAGGCKVDQQKFQARVFKCDTTAPDPLCGTDADGVPMTCFAARQIGGADFCAASCGDLPMSLPEEGAVCVQGNAKLKFCNPDDDDNLDGTHPDGACGRPDLGCLRTDVAAPGDVGEGVCITGNPCLTDDNCRDPVRSRCAATFLKDLYKGAPNLRSDHLYCLQEGCSNGGSFCSPGEVCLPTVIPQAVNAPDICVPKCDSHGRCPPNHFCLETISGPANPAVCIPGLLGFVCETDVDCLVGKCKSDNVEQPELALKLCTVACESDAECAKYDSDQGIFVCSEGPENRHCVTPSAYTGALCRTTADCGHRDKGTVCARQRAEDKTGTCLFPCDAKTPCAARDGVGHTCVPFVGDDKMPAGACIPGLFGYPCFDKSQCAVSALACAGADLANKLGPMPGLCTQLCTTDADCDENKWTAGQSYCGGVPPTTVCLPLRGDGEECEAARQCASKLCEMPSGSGMTKTCGGKAK